MTVSLFKNSSEVVDGKCRTVLLYSCHRATPAFTLIFQGTCFNCCCILVIFDGKSDATYKPKLQGHSYLRRKPIMASENMHTDEAQMFSYANVHLQLVNLVY